MALRRVTNPRVLRTEGFLGCGTSVLKPGVGSRQTRTGPPQVPEGSGPWCPPESLLSRAEAWPGRLGFRSSWLRNTVLDGLEAWVANAETPCTGPTSGPRPWAADKGSRRRCAQVGGTACPGPTAPHPQWPLPGAVPHQSAALLPGAQGPLLPQQWVSFQEVRVLSLAGPGRLQAGTGGQSVGAAAGRMRLVRVRLRGWGTDSRALLLPGSQLEDLGAATYKGRRG